MPRLKAMSDVRDQGNVSIFFKKELVFKRLAACSFSPDNVSQVGRVDVITNEVQLRYIPPWL
jgi:hypothetical protein